MTKHDAQDESWFPLDDCPSDRAVVIVAELTRFARAWTALGVEPDHLTGVVPLSLPRIQPELVLGSTFASKGLVLRVFRVDLYLTLALVGEDDSKQIAGELDPAHPGVVTVQGNAADVADGVASWIEKELRRPVELREWDVRDFCYRRWYLADTDRVLCADNTIFRFVPEDLGPPDRVIVVRDQNGPVTEARSVVRGRPPR